MKFRFSAFFRDGSVKQVDLDGTDKCDHPDFVKLVDDFEKNPQFLDLHVIYQAAPGQPFQVIDKA
jgi:hypothetical protein